MIRGHWFPICIIIIIIFGSTIAADLTTIQKTERACYGSDDSCSKYQLICDKHHVIVVGKMVYATKPLQNCTFGVSNCVQTKLICCTYNETDTFTEFSDYNRTKISKQCNGKVSCSGQAPRLGKAPYSHYVVMNYTCVPESLVRSSTYSAALIISTTWDHSSLSSVPAPTYITSTHIPVTTNHKPKPSKQTIIISTILPSAMIQTSSTKLSYFPSTLHSKSSGVPTDRASSQISTSHSKHSTITTAAALSTTTIPGQPSLHTVSSLMPHTGTKPTTSSSVRSKSSLSSTSSWRSSHVPETTTCKTTTESDIEVKKDNDDLDKGLVIGLIVGLLAALALIILIIVCVCLRMKRKEKIRQHIYRNTNIFYTFPDDLKDTGSTMSDCKSVETIEHDDTVTIQANELYEPLDDVESQRDQNQNTFDIGKYIILPVGDDSIESSNSRHENMDDEDINTERSVIENETSCNEGDVISDSNGTRRVHFDPSELYASVRKEGRTKF